MKMRVHSFTLIELLIDITIISILAALLGPSLREAKEKANRIKCMSDARQIGLAIEYYKEDNDQFYPIRGDTSLGGYDDKKVYMNILGSNYMKSVWDVFKCPSNKNTVSMDLRTNSLGGRMDYVMNSGVYNMQANGTNSSGESICIPTIAVVLYEWPGPHIYYSPQDNIPAHPSKGINAYFADGHLAWLSYDEAMSTKEGHSPFWRWGRTP